MLLLTLLMLGTTTAGCSMVDKHFDRSRSSDENPAYLLKNKAERSFVAGRFFEFLPIERQTSA